MADIFISYAREDQGRIEELVSALEQQGWSVFWDRRIPSGLTWRSYIGNSLENARCVIVAWSRHSVNSTWVAEEADNGRRRSVLVPVLLERVEQPLGFREIQAADLTDWQPGCPSFRFDNLIKDISGLLYNAQTRPSGNPMESSAVPRVCEDRIVQSTPSAYSKRFIFAVVAVVSVLSIPVVAYLSFKELIANPPAHEQPSFDVRAVINDPDGYTNVRSTKSDSSDENIVFRVYNGEEFYITNQQNSNWWRIKTKDGKIGYMHASRILILK